MSTTEPTLDALSDAQEQSDAGRLVWDLPVRIFHWGLAACFVAALVTNKLGVKYFKAHEIIGYTALVLISFRILWGLVGTRHARFWNFLRGPNTVLAYLRDPNGAHYVGHNPAGAVMVVVLLAGAFVQGATGLFANDEIFNTGPLVGYVTKDVSLALTSIHRRLFYVLLVPIALHVLAVIGHKIFKGENLVTPMFTGRKSDAAEAETIKSSRLWLAAPLVAGVIAALVWIIETAPHAALDGDY
jgi:cytochrome b